jgi:large subunit ribosomal protein L17
MLGNLAMSILDHHRVETQHQKALEVRRVVERLITYGKQGDLSARRLAARVVHRPLILKKLFKEIAPKFQGRNGGYCRILKKGFRRGDNAPISIIELVGLAQEEKVEKKGKSKKSAKKTTEKKPEKAAAPKADAKKADKKADKKE